MADKVFIQIANPAIRSGTRSPLASDGNNGDYWIYYVGSADMRLYGPKISGAWSGTYYQMVGTPGTNGTNGAMIWTGTGAPSAAMGAVGDLYVNTAGAFYTKTGVSTWTLQANLTGPQGNPGTGALLFMDSININATGTFYASMSGNLIPYVTPYENVAAHPVPSPITLTTLYVRNSPADGNTTSANHTVTLRKNGVDTGLTVTLPSGSVPGTQVTVTSSVPFLAGDTISLKVVMGGGNIVDIRCSLGGAVTGGGGYATQFSTYAGTITGALNGENPTFTLSSPPSAILELYVDGSRQVPGIHYTWTAGTSSITFIAGAIPHSGAIIAAQGW